MPDITMCLNKLCPNAGTCKRVQSMPSDYQSYADFKYEISVDGIKCDSYWPTHQYKITSDTVSQ